MFGTQAFAKTHHQQIQIKQGERMQTRFEKGLKQLQSIDGEAGSKVISSLEDIAPDLGRFIIEFAFGDIYTRGELNLHFLYFKGALETSYGFT